MKRFTGVFCALLACILVVGAGEAFAATTRTVGDPLTCAKASYSSVQAAVDASASGDRIRVCPGTYVEQVSIPAGKNNLTIEATQHWNAVIKAPAAMTSPKAVVRVNGAAGTTLKGLTITGPGSGACASIDNGVRVDAGGFALIQDDHITNISDTPLGGCQNGVAIQVGRQADATSGGATIKSNTIEGYQKNGITVDGTGSYATITDNTITGAGPTSAIAQNGIQVSRSATAVVRHNAISGNWYAPGTTSSTGILLFGPLGAVTVQDNTLSGNDTGVYASGANVHTLIYRNTVSGSHWDGITVENSTAPKVTKNTITGGDQGIGVYNTTNALIQENHVSGAATNGLFAGSDTSSNLFQNNFASGTTGAGHYDCRDDSVDSNTAGTKNSWKKNHGATSNRAGLCTA